MIVNAARHYKIMNDYVNYFYEGQMGLTIEVRAWLMLWYALEDGIDRPISRGGRGMEDPATSVVASANGTPGTPADLKRFHGASICTCAACDMV